MPDRIVLGCRIGRNTQFVDMSPEGDQEWFCDGIAEEIINAMTKVAGLSPTARTSAFSFKGKQMDDREIGSKLSVSTLLEGSIQKAHVDSVALIVLLSLHTLH